MLTFQAKTEEELQIESLLSEGYYKMRVVESVYGHSEKGNPQIKLKLLEPEHDRVISTQLNAKFLKILKHFCDAAKLEYKYQQGTLEAHDCLDKDVWVHVGIKPHYKDEKKRVNYVEDFVKEPPAGHAKEKDIPFIDDKDIPF